MKARKLWLLYAVIVMIAWGLWGALIDAPAEAGFPETLGYVVWAGTMILPAVIALQIIGWKLEYDPRSVVLGCLAGFLGAGGQLILFKALRIAPAYLVFPFIALSPLVTIVMALVISRERATIRGWMGILLALAAGVLLAVPSSAPPPLSGNVASNGGGSTAFMWVLLALPVLLAWGIQGFVISYANLTMKAESVFFYMMLTALLLIPVALAMTDFHDPDNPINWGFTGPGLAALIQILNAAGALLLVYAFRYGKAIVVSPLTNAGAPLITIVLSLGLAVAAGTAPLHIDYHRLGEYGEQFQLLITGTTTAATHAAGMIAAVAATLLMALEEGKK
jgi:drug/metabolite transporter (DMT)-like permease